MQLNWSATIPNIPLFTPQHARQVAQQEMGQAVFEVVELIADKARTRAPVNLGILRSSIFTEVKPGTGQTLVTGLVATGKQAPYARFVESGTKPHWAPIAPLKAWARRVLGDEQAAYAVQHAIAQRGTKAQPFFAPSVAEVEKIAPGIVNAAHQRLAVRLQTH
jgi:HK97 gp10 family phage protein